MKLPNERANVRAPTDLQVVSSSDFHVKQKAKIAPKMRKIVQKLILPKISRSVH